jgi:hypothetical protein
VPVRHKKTQPAPPALPRAPERAAACQHRPAPRPALGVHTARLPRSRARLPQAFRVPMRLEVIPPRTAPYRPVRPRFPSRCVPTEVAAVLRRACDIACAPEHEATLLLKAVVLPLREDAAHRADLGRRTTLGTATLGPCLRPFPPPSRRSKTSTSPPGTPAARCLPRPEARRGWQPRRPPPPDTGAPHRRRLLTPDHAKQSEP